MEFRHRWSCPLDLTCSQRDEAMDADDLHGAWCSQQDEGAEAMDADDLHVGALDRFGSSILIALNAPSFAPHPGISQLNTNPEKKQCSIFTLSHTLLQFPSILAASHNHCW